MQWRGAPARFRSRRPSRAGPLGRLSLASLAALLLVGCAAALRWDGEAPSASGQYQVRSGDTLYSIAMRHNLDYRDLARWNGIDSGYRIYPGQRLQLQAPPAGQVARAPSPPPSRPSSDRGSGRQPPAREQPAAIRTPPPSTGPLQWDWPLQGEIVRRFALPESKGINLAAEIGTPVRAAGPGKVVYSGDALKGYGELIIVKHDETYLSVYGHNRRRLAQEGDTVDAGTVIGEVGMGPQRRPLLHFEIRKAGQPTDPLALLPRRD